MIRPERPSRPALDREPRSSHRLARREAAGPFPERIRRRDGTNPIRAVRVAHADGTNPIRAVRAALAYGTNPIRAGRMEILDGTNPNCEDWNASRDGTNPIGTGRRALATERTRSARFGRSSRRNEPDFRAVSPLARRNEPIFSG